MSLSQDEINALLKEKSNDAADAEPVDILSPEEVASMLDEAATSADDVGGQDSIEIMSSDEIASMLDEAGNGVDVNGGGPGGSYSAGATGDDATDSGDALANVLVKQGMLTDDEVDILGEVGNISMGAVATTMYSLLDRRVSITTPRVTVFDAKDVLSVYRVPFVVATIEYVEGISGTNLLVLKIEDAALITDILMGGDGKLEGPVELNEMHLSAMSEIMNQMMGASSTSLSKLLRKSINISPPQSTQVDVGFDVSNLLENIDMVTKISFDMEIEGLLKSELIQLIPYDLSREFAKQFLDIGMGGSQQESEEESAPPPAPPQVSPAAPPPPPPQAPSEAPNGARSPQAYQAQGAVPLSPPNTAYPQPPAQQFNTPYPQEAYQQMPYQQPPYGAPPPYQQAPYQQAQYQQPVNPQAPYPAAPQYPQAASQGRVVDVHPMQFQAFDSSGPIGEQRGIDLVYNIPLQVTVELGKTKKEISEILEFSTGTVIVLDKIAGDPVEIVVNGKLIARGEVVVIDENYGVRITAIING